MPADAGVLTAEFKVNLLSPATSSDSLLAEGQVVRASPRPAERLSAAAEVGVADPTDGGASEKRSSPVAGSWS
jgi:acyl-coenzyme A thioesterase PaaI-like protein